MYSLANTVMIFCVIVGMGSIINFRLSNLKLITPPKDSHLDGGMEAWMGCLEEEKGDWTWSRDSHMVNP